MALTRQDETKKVYPPIDLPGVKDGDWLEISIVFTAGLRRRLARQSQVANWRDANVQVDAFGYRHALLAEIIRGWSEPEAFTAEAIEVMDPAVVDWIANEFDRLSSGRTEDEKKDSSELSSATSEPEMLMEPSLPSSVTS